MGRKRRGPNFLVLFSPIFMQTLHPYFYSLLWSFKHQVTLVLHFVKLLVLMLPSFVRILRSWIWRCKCFISNVKNSNVFCHNFHLFSNLKSLRMNNGLSKQKCAQHSLWNYLLKILICALSRQVWLFRSDKSGGTSIDTISKLNTMNQISVPPHSPQIQSGDSRIDTSRAIAGVYNEGDIMDLTCVSVGGEKFEF